MRTRITMIICLCLLFAGRASAQWVVSDPGNLAQGIINASKNIIHTSKTATNMVSNFQETVKIYQQGKKYYDALRSVNNLVKDARKVQQTILMVGDITDIYVNSFQRMLRLHDRQGAHGRGGTLLLQNEALPQPCELLHQQEHLRELSACEEKERPRPHHGAVREHERKILVAYGV